MGADTSYFFLTNADSLQTKEKRASPHDFVTFSKKPLAWQGSKKDQALPSLGKGDRLSSGLRITSDINYKQQQKTNERDNNEWIISD